jgi:pseudouridine-5'-monophosphatase
VIFDLDGVLLDSEPIYTEATRQVVAPYGKVFDWSIKGEIIGRSSVEGARHVVSALGLPLTPEDYLRRRRPLLEALFREVTEIPGARRFVESLHARAVPLAVATSSEAPLYRLKTAHHSWFEQFAVIVCGDDPRITRLKPAPDVFLVTAQLLGVSPERCLVFEDSLAGVSAARAAGMQVIALPDPAMDKSRYAEADLVISGYDELTPADIGL